MHEAAAVHSTFVVERGFAKPPDKVFGAFADPVKKRRWFAEGRAHDIVVFEMDFRVDGLERFTYRFREGTLFPGVVVDNHNRFLDIAANRRIVISQAMDLANKRVSATLVTIELLRTEKGTDLICTHQGVFLEGSGGPELRQQGWITLFERLAQELEG